MDTEGRIQRVKSDGLTLAVEERGQGQPLFFAHGLTSNRTQSLRQVGDLARDHRVIIFDQRGHAQSTPITDACLYDVQRMAGDITAILDTLGVREAVVGGESMGAATTLRFALNHPERVTKLCLCLPALSDELLPARADVHTIGEAMKSKGLPAFAEENMHNDIASGASPERARAWADVLRSHDVESMALACQVVPDWLVYQRKDELERLTMPVLIVAIDGDPVHPLTLAQRLAKQIPHARLHVVEPASRYFENPPLVGELIAGFLASVP